MLYRYALRPRRRRGRNQMLHHKKFISSQRAAGGSQFSFPAISTWLPPHASRHTNLIYILMALDIDFLKRSIFFVCV
ncbi:MAG: hypothetical protein RML37_07600 [Chitinophagales bacterium]|nr:hypothetical protein [Chitinophagales bacterium]